MSDQIRIVVPSLAEESLGISQVKADRIIGYRNEFKLIGDGRTVADAKRDKKYYKFAIIGAFGYMGVMLNFRILKKSNKEITGRMLQKALDKKRPEEYPQLREVFAAVNVRDEAEAAITKKGGK